MSWGPKVKKVRAIEYHALGTALPSVCNSISRTMEHSAQLASHGMLSVLSRRRSYHPWGKYGACMKLGCKGKATSQREDRQAS